VKPTDRTPEQRRRLAIEPAAIRAQAALSRLIGEHAYRSGVRDVLIGMALETHGVLDEFGRQLQREARRSPAIEVQAPPPPPRAQRPPRPPTPRSFPPPSSSGWPEPDPDIERTPIVTTRAVKG